jgi:hypothetical protein
MKQYRINITKNQIITFKLTFLVLLRKENITIKLHYKKSNIIIFKYFNLMQNKFSSKKKKVR